MDWLKFSEEFITGLDLEPNLITTQIEPHDNLAEIFHNIIIINNILLSLDRDMWTYISMDYLKQKAKEVEVVSSTIPQKVNTIDFENSKGNLGIANGLMGHLSRKLPVSRLQRDLSDSTALRNIGIGFAYCVIAYRSTLKGLQKIEVNKEKIKMDLENYSEIITEGIQTILRREGIIGGYEKLKELSRGRKITKKILRSLLEVWMFLKKLRKN